MNFVAEHDPMMEAFLYETRQFLDELERLALETEQSGSFSEEQVNEIFRAMHTIKGSAAMMMLNEVSTLAHAVEDIFFYIREKHPQVLDVSTITDFVLAATDFIRCEADKLDEGSEADGNSADMCEQTKMFLRAMKEANGDDPDEDLRKYKASKSSAPAAEAAPSPAPAQQFYIAPAKAEPEVSKSSHVYAAVIFFDDGCEMEEVRAYAVINNIQDKVTEVHYKPERLLEDADSPEYIKQKGFKLWFTTALGFDEVKALLDQTIFLKSLDLKELNDVSECEFWPTLAEVAKAQAEAKPIKPKVEPSRRPTPAQHSDSQVISVKVEKLDRLMDLVGELVIAEAMVTQNPELKGLELDGFQKAARQLHKINGELQDSVMAIRMVPLEATFQKMNRIVRDMTKNLGKKAKLVLVGEDTEVDKNVIDHIGDPLMHIIRNSIDHGIEMPDVRIANGKSEQGTVTLAADNSGSEVVIRIIDDGGGLNKEKILERARNNGIINKPESELTDKEIYSFIFAPGFSTKEAVTEYSGRGVGMDVVVSNIKQLGGQVLVDSIPGQGSTTTLKIPLTLAIIEGMSMKVGKATYTIPIISVRQSFRPDPKDVFYDPDGTEMIMVRGQCYPIVRLGKVYGVSDAETELDKGILILVESDKRMMGIFADRLLGVSEIVVKPVPKYLAKVSQTQGITGCTLLGDGSISLILDAVSLNRALFKEA